MLQGHVCFSCCQVFQCYCHFQSKFKGLRESGDFLLDVVVDVFLDEVKNCSYIILFLVFERSMAGPRGLVAFFSSEW